MKKLILMGICVMMLMVTYGAADVPLMINYQGRLTDADGTPVSDGTYQINFTLYGSESGYDTLWWSDPQTIQVTGGLFEHLLGTNTSIPIEPSLFDAPNLYLAVSIDGGSEMIPRTKLATVPYSFISENSNRANGVADNAVGSSQIINGSIGFEDIAQNGASPGQVIKWNGSGWSPANDSIGNETNWTLSGDVLYTGGEWGISRAGNVLLGNSDSTHVNLGGACTTGTATTDYKYCTISGGFVNKAVEYLTTIGGGMNNTANGYGATIGGGTDNLAGWNATVGGGCLDTASGYASAVGGGGGNTARAAYSTIGGGSNNTAGEAFTTIGGGSSNLAKGNSSIIGGGKFGTANGDYSGVFSGSNNLAGINAIDTAIFVGGGTYNAALGNYSTLAGGDSNYIASFAPYGTISGGRIDSVMGQYGAVGGGYNNKAGGKNSTVGGGGNNTAGDSASTVGGGINNNSSGIEATIGGGASNTASEKATVGGGYNNIADGIGATVGGGYSNAALAYTSTVSGGTENTASAGDATVGGGHGNSAGGLYTVIGGGYNNHSNTDAATVGGGYSNTAGGYGSTVPGGVSCEASGHYSFAAGRNAKASHAGTFVWADSGSTDFISTGPSQFLIRASGGVGINTQEPLSALHVHQGALRLSRTSVQYLDLYDSSAAGAVIQAVSSESNKKAMIISNVHDGTGSPAGNNQIILQTGNINSPLKVMTIMENGSVGIGTNNPSSALHVVGDICYTGSIGACSDARYKQDVKTITGALERLNRLRGVNFKWKQDEYPAQKFDDRPQFGLIAQEVKEVFPELVMEDNEGYYSVDYVKLTPVLVEAVKELKAENDELKARLTQLESLMESLSAQQDGN